MEHAKRAEFLVYIKREFVERVVQSHYYHAAVGLLLLPLLRVAQLWFEI